MNLGSYPQILHLFGRQNTSCSIHADIHRIKSITLYTYFLYCSILVDCEFEVGEEHVDTCVDDDHDVEEEGVGVPSLFWSNLGQGLCTLPAAEERHLVARSL